MIRERRGSHCKSDESTDRGIEKRFTAMLPKAVWTLAKVRHSKGITFKEMLCKYNM
jgi:hypothetical protein